MLNHLLLFSEYIDIDLKTKSVKVRDSKMSELKALLDWTKSKIEAADFCYGETDWITEGASNP